MLKSTRVLSTTLALGFSLMLTSCGHKDAQNVQEEQRSDVKPLLQGSWNSKCENSLTNRLSFEGDRLTVERVSFYDAECQEKRQTVRQSGTFELSHTFKEGVLNSIVFSPDNDLRVTLNTDYEVDNLNNRLSDLRNEKSIQTTETMPAPQKKQIARENQKLFEAQKVTAWKRDEEKTLNRFQWEKLSSLGLSANPPVVFNTRQSLRYELDNGFLQVYGASDFQHVFVK